MKPEFCIGINRNGVLYEGMTAKALYRECPKYDHPWYAGQADWIVTDIELHGRPVSATFRAAFHNSRFRELREGLSRVTQGRTEVLDSVLIAHDRTTELSIRITPNKGALEVAFVLTRHIPKVGLQFESERRCEDIPEIVRGLDQIDALFPVLGTGEEADIETCQSSRKPGLPFLRFVGTLVSLPRLFKKGTTTNVPMELYMEYEDQCVARLTDPRYEEMFWTSFAFTPLTQDPALMQLLESRDFWRGSEDYKIRYRFVDDGHVAFGTFPGAAGVRGGRVSLRTSALVH